MAVSEIHVGDEGTRIILIVKDQSGAVVDIAGATDMKYIFKKPGVALSVEKTAVLLSDGSDGALLYVVEPGFIDVQGTWKVQAEATIGAWKGKSDVFSFEVYPNL